MKLFKYEGFNLTISEEAMLLTPFKVLWKRDKSKTKDTALMELGYIYFMEDPRSDYQVYIDKKERSRQIKLGEGLPEKWNPDKDVLAAMEFYSSFKSEAALLLEDTRAASAKLRKKIKELDLDEVDSKGKPVYTLNNYATTLSMVPKIITALDEAEKAVSKDIVQSDKARGSVEKSMYEDI